MTRALTSDSVNLGSNPSSPAIYNVSAIEVSRALAPSSLSEKTERTAHIGRTEVGTAATSLPFDRINLARKLLRLHGEIRTWVALNRDRRPPDLVFAVEWMGCAIYCAGANGLDASDAEALLLKAWQQIAAESQTVSRG
jgi:hypothetical protein